MTVILAQRENPLIAISAILTQCDRAIAMTLGASDHAATWSDRSRCFSNKRSRCHQERDQCKPVGAHIKIIITMALFFINFFSFLYLQNSSITIQTTSPQCKENRSDLLPKPYGVSPSLSPLPKIPSLTGHPVCITTKRQLSYFTHQESSGNGLRRYMFSLTPSGRTLKR